MLKYLLNPRLRSFWIFFHLLLGLISVFSPVVLIIWFYFSFLLLLKDIFVSKKVALKSNLVFIISYLVSFEILCRMTKTSPYIPYELSKYVLFILLTYGISLNKSQFHVGWVMFFLLIPSLFFDLSGSVNNYQYYVFNILGPVNTALGFIFFSKCNITFQGFEALLFLLLCPVISVLLYAYVKTPDYSDIQFNLGANFETSGGFGSNQVSTVLGLGMFIVFVFWFCKWNLSGYKIFDLFLFFGFVFQGLITFSRGGIISAILAILFFVLINSIYKKSNKNKTLNLFNLGNVLVILSFILFAFIVANGLSKGNLFLRYKGETEGTLNGYKVQTLNNISSNRFNIFIGDFNLWMKHPLLGVGIGASQSLRDEVNGIIAHVELSRLLAEHGFLGLMFFTFLLIIPYKSIKKENNSLVKALKYSFYFIALFTTFHASMRTYVSPLLLGLSLISISVFSFKPSQNSISNTKINH